MQKFVFIIGFLAFTAVWFWPTIVKHLYENDFEKNAHTLSVENLSETQLITLTKNDLGNNRFASGIVIHLTGQLDGTAKLVTNPEKESSEEHILSSGPIDLKIGGPWTESSYQINYQPENITNGNLQIRYKFYGE